MTSTTGQGRGSGWALSRLSRPAILRRATHLVAGVALLFSTASTCSPSPKAPDAQKAQDGDGTGSTSSGPSSSLAEFFGPDLTLRQKGQFGLDRTELKQESDQPFSTFLRVRYPSNSSSNQSAREDGTNEGGAQAYLQAAASDHLFLRYRLRLPAGFDFVKGGKLPGLYGGTMTSGGNIPDGTDGFSTRYMWRSQGAGEVYAYLPTSEEHGTSLGRGSWTWPTSRWTCVEQEVRLNDPGKSNGSVRVLLDGKPVLQEGALTYRSTSSLQIDGLFFSTFFGGGDSTWATPRTQYADFADVKVSADPIGC